VSQVREVWDAGQLAGFLDEIKADRLYPYFRLAAYTGARRGHTELLFLRWSSVVLGGDDPRVNRERRVLPPIRFHHLRHVHATLLLQGGEPVHGVAERLGHADPSMTLRVYAHVIRSQRASSADRRTPR
jgi:integrase